MGFIYAFPYRDLLASESLLSGLQFVLSDSSENPGQVLLRHKLAADQPEASYLQQTDEEAKLTPWGQPYLWAQQLAGQKCLPCVSGMETSNNTNLNATKAPPSLFGFIDTWFSAVTRRIECRRLLNAEANTLAFMLYFD